MQREINEVFELRKVQRLEQQLREQLEERLSHSEVHQLEELSRSTESDSGFDSSSTTATAKQQAGAATSASPVTTKLRALSPPPLSPRIPYPATTPPAPVSQGEDVNIWACKFLRDLDSLMADSSPHLAASGEGSRSGSACGSGSASSSPISRTAPILLSAAASAALQSRYGKGTSAGEQSNGLVLKPEKHVSTQSKLNRLRYRTNSPPSGMPNYVRKPVCS